MSLGWWTRIVAGLAVAAAYIGIQTASLKTADVPTRTNPAPVAQAQEAESESSDLTHLFLSPSISEPQEYESKTDFFNLNADPSFKTQGLELLAHTIDGRYNHLADPSISHQAILENRLTVTCSYSGFISDTHPKGKGGSATGTALTSDGWVITAWHAIDDFVGIWQEINEHDPLTHKNRQEWRMKHDNYHIEFSDGTKRTIDTRIWFANPDKDIALIKASTDDQSFPHPIRFTSFDPSAGEPIMLYGLRNKIPFDQKGSIAQLSDLENLPNSYFLKSQGIHTTTLSTHGFSGGLYVSRFGEVLGVNCELINRFPHQNDEEIYVGYGQGAKGKYVVDLICFAQQQINRHHISYEPSSALIVLNTLELTNSEPSHAFVDFAHPIIPPSPLLDPVDYFRPSFDLLSLQPYSLSISNSPLAPLVIFPHTNEPTHYALHLEGNVLSTNTVNPFQHTPLNTQNHSSTK